VIALQRVVAEVAPSDHHEKLRAEVERIGERLIDRPCELLPGVAPTLGELARRHRLLLFTKGDPREQLRKLDRSGLRPLFTRVGVPLEKDSWDLPPADRASRSGSGAHFHDRQQSAL
jgi:phosphoglycolate phosphatase-like HAD superfamily hydrolase